MPKLQVHHHTGFASIFVSLSILLVGTTATSVLAQDRTWPSGQPLEHIAQGRPSTSAARQAPWTLSFEANRQSDERIAFDLDLLKTETTDDRRATVAQGSQIGNLNLIRGDGRSVGLDRYQWTIDDQSRVYIGKSGYKYMLLLYNYGRTDARSYQLKMVCQTRAAEAICQLADNGPLLNQDLVSKGTLDFGPTAARLPRTATRPDPSFDSTTATGTLTNVAPEVTPDRPLEAAILAQFSEQDQRTQTFRYVYNRADLNGDGDPEVFAYLENSSFCNGQRCPLLVFSPQPTGYKLLTKLPLVSPPVIVNDSKTWGWNDLVVVDEGAAEDSQYRMLRYTGQKYPQSLSAAETLSPSRVAGKALLSDRTDTSPQRNIAPARPQSTTPAGT
ncbi:MAG: hypothetical protein ACFCU8_18330 [Thermosynechococcaceae cyanobacterium]